MDRDGYQAVMEAGTSAVARRPHLVRATPGRTAPRGGRKIQTGPLPRLPDSALIGAHTIERFTLPSLFLGAFAVLVIIQVLLAL